MSQPDLAPRVDRLEQDLTAISDTVLDIKETVDTHTETLTAIQQTQREHGEVLNAILARLDDAR